MSAGRDPFPSRAELHSLAILKYHSMRAVPGLYTISRTRGAQKPAPFGISIERRADGHLYIRPEPRR